MVGKIRLYCKGFEGREEIISWDIQKIKKKQIIKITFIQKKSYFKQGIRLAVDSGRGLVEVNGQKGKTINLWQETAPYEVICKCISDEGLISVYNIFDMGKGRRSLGFTSGMLLEQKGEKTIYHCNDWGIDTNFDKLIFSFEKIEEFNSH